MTRRAAFRLDNQQTPCYFKGRMNVKNKKTLWQIAEILDGVLGDTDPDLLDDVGFNLPDDEIKQEYPIFWACREVIDICRSLDPKGIHK